MNIFQDLTLIQRFALWIFPALLAIIVHEVSHGWAANYFGDKTAKYAGRLTLNPIKHIDPIGTFLVPVTLFILNTGFLFGWAKPVPVDPRNFKKPVSHMAWVALAGPLSNYTMALLWALCMKAMIVFHPMVTPWMVAMLYMVRIGIFFNILLGTLNLLPIPPLDGSRIIIGFLPPKVRYYFSCIEPYGFIILIILLFTGVLWFILDPIMYFTTNMITRLVGL